MIAGKLQEQDRRWWQHEDCSDSEEVWKPCESGRCCLPATSGRLVHDDLGEVIEPLLPGGPIEPKGGRPRVLGRAALADIIPVLGMGRLRRLLSKEPLC